MIGHGECAIAERAGGERVRLPPGELEKGFCGEGANKACGDEPGGSGGTAGGQEIDAGEEHGEREESGEGRIEGLEGEFTLGPVETAEFFLDGVRKTVTREPDDGRR